MHINAEKCDAGIQTEINDIKDEIIISQKKTVSRIFYTTLQTLAAATVNLVFMQRMHVVQATMPKCFYPNESFHRNHAWGFHMSEIESCWWKSDSQITIESGLIDKLEEGDMVLADKRFPEIKATIDQTGKKIMLVMPPFLKKKMNLHLKKLRKLIM
ncbi:hypothetical protein PV325_011566 [Microctonus aethiopoides]|nr:hypothetical protein PV325_011566 [Microctonus aethiopoides]